MPAGDPDRLSRAVSLVTCLLLFGYAAYRAYALSFTHDESLSYTIARFDSGWVDTANHHPLNTWMMKASAALFGHGEAALRLPNLLSFFLYLGVCHHIASRAANGLLALLALSVLLLNPFLLEYFSLARGYGLSLGFMAVSLLFALRATAEQSYRTGLRDFCAAGLLGAVATFSSFSSLNYYIALLALFAVHGLRRAIVPPGLTRIELVVSGAMLAVAMIPLISAIRRLLALGKAQQLYFGSDTWGEAAASLISTWMLLPEAEPVSSNLGRGCVLAVGVISVIVAMRRRWSRPEFNLAILLIVIGVALVLEHRFFDARFPRERTGLYVIPILGLLLYSLADAFHARLPAAGRRGFTFALGLLIVAPLVYNFLSTAGLQYSHTWRYDAHTRGVIDHVVASDRYDAAAQRRIRLSNHWLFEPTLNYYISLRDLAMEPADREGFNPNADFHYGFTSEAAPPGFRAVVVFEDIGTVLYQQSEPRMDTNEHESRRDDG